MDNKFQDFTRPGDNIPDADGGCDTGYSICPHCGYTLNTVMGNAVPHDCFVSHLDKQLESKRKRKKSNR